MLAVKELRNGLQQRLQAYACRISSTSAKLICRAAARATAQLLLRFAAPARARFNALT